MTSYRQVEVQYSDCETQGGFPIIPERKVGTERSQVIQSYLVSLRLACAT